MLSSLFKSVLLLALALSIVACSSLYPDKKLHTRQHQLLSQLSAQLQGAGLPADALAFTAYPLDNAAEKVSYQAEKSMQPASTMKLLTSIAALEQLGPAYRGKTQLRAYEQAQENMQHPLVLKGLADMDFTLQQLWYLLQQAHDQGIRQVPAIQIDRSWFNPARPELTALPFDETPREYYNLLPDALFLQRNMLGIRLQSTADSISGQFYPSLHGLELVTTQVQLTDIPCAQWYPHPQHMAFKRQPHAVQLVLQGEFPKNCQKRDYLQLINRVDFSRLAVQQLWQQISGQKEVPVLEQNAAEATVLLAEHQSRTLAEVLRDMNKSSDNAVTRQLYLTLGAQQSAVETQLTAQSSELQIRSFISSLGLDHSSLRLENGSGLSRSERISPQLMTALLQHAYQARYQPELIASMPLAGVDGTLKRRFTQPQTQGKARLKTGTLRNVVALAGFVTDQSGRTWVVASFINDPTAGRGREVLDGLIEWITRQQDKNSLQ
ncbi:D-alanyl-D-alanine carboxypeptidase/D-alanyl-D-alanine-endopeptidase [Rheinheimera sp. 1928-s]|uniref:D-alanyl-D-alanine carboxypeptidase/D-alanyl-D-alanine endopeptidase n=1 Tax=Rheinheimera sp. 1928-s TaxID=3033803 RepID=UPI0026230893|nr:D-alanyl-D-alanine carboxypeptidase/D-alanyl-D-alanine-endopeptidase [Rheinheimera sp. 1928-s]MDF3127172.1 D-alanyl-D-alanine carboxypeptidase/D-alanyl-D-alanine-endopeptidase [Rheinheimera sp. 1928-s]